MTKLAEMHKYAPNFMEYIKTLSKPYDVTDGRITYTISAVESSKQGNYMLRVNENNPESSYPLLLHMGLICEHGHLKALLNGKYDAWYYDPKKKFEYGFV